MQGTFPVIGTVAFAIIINIPCGYLRQGYRKFSFMWFLLIHVSIPFIVLLRINTGTSWHYIPLTLSGAIAGQLIGGRIGRGRSRDDEEK